MTNTSQTNTTTAAAPPAGFKIAYYCQCNLGCSPEYLKESGDECEIVASAHEGPSVHLKENPGFQLNSYWDKECGLTFQIHHSGYESETEDAEYVQKPITRKELELLPHMIRRVLDMIDEAK